MNSYRVQDLVLAQEIGTCGTLTEITFQAASAATGAEFNGWEMRLCHTTLDELTDNFADNYDGNTPQLVHAADPLVLSCAVDDWLALDGFITFEYNGVDNLLVEYQWSGDNSTDIDTWMWTADCDRLLYHKYLDSPTGYLSTKLHRFRLSFADTAVEQASWGRIKAAGG